MNSTWQTAVGQQFGAAIDTLDNAIAACPGELWLDRLWDNPGERPEWAQFWYLAYHTLFWLDLYLWGAVEGFAPPAPYTLDELDPAGVPPDRPYTQAELRAYAEYCREKCRAAIEALDDEAAQHLCRFRWGELSYASLLLYNMRHVQEHAAQLLLWLGRKAGGAPGWVTGVRRPAG
jgi:hypothetical protein